MKERQRPDTEKESFWHAVAITAEMFHDCCQERLDKEDTK